MDRNHADLRFIAPLNVALRKESVDRNHDDYLKLAKFEVALRKESVDRNLPQKGGGLKTAASLSARRAWIEMVIDFPLDKFAASLSARRAWIEISSLPIPFRV